MANTGDITSLGCSYSGVSILNITCPDTVNTDGSVLPFTVTVPAPSYGYQPYALEVTYQYIQTGNMTPTGTWSVTIRSCIEPIGYFDIVPLCGDGSSYTISNMLINCSGGTLTSEPLGGYVAGGTIVNGSLPPEPTCVCPDIHGSCDSATSGSAQMTMQITGATAYYQYCWPTGWGGASTLNPNYSPVTNRTISPYIQSVGAPPVLEGGGPSCFGGIISGGTQNSGSDFVLAPCDSIVSVSCSPTNVTIEGSIYSIPAPMFCNWINSAGTGLGPGYGILTENNSYEWRAGTVTIVTVLAGTCVLTINQPPCFNCVPNEDDPPIVPVPTPSECLLVFNSGPTLLFPDDTEPCTNGYYINVPSVIGPIPTGTWTFTKIKIGVIAYSGWAQGCTYTGLQIEIVNVGTCSGSSIAPWGPSTIALPVINTSAGEWFAQEIDINIPSPSHFTWGGPGSYTVCVAFTNIGVGTVDCIYGPYPWIPPSGSSAVLAPYGPGQITDCKYGLKIQWIALYGCSSSIGIPWNMADPDKPYHRLDCGIGAYYRSDDAVPLPSWAVNGAPFPQAKIARLVVDQFKRIHSIFSLAMPGSSPDGPNIFSVFSDDEGNSWSTQEPMSNFNDYCDFPAVAKDSFGGILTLAVDTQLNEILAQWQDIGQVTPDSGYHLLDGTGTPISAELDSFNVCASPEQTQRMYMHLLNQGASQTNIYWSSGGKYATWFLDTPSVLTGVHPTINVDQDCNILASVFVPASEGASYGSISGSIRKTGDESFSAPFDFLGYDGSPLQVYDTQFNIVECFENPARYILTAVEWNPETSSPGDIREWVSADYGQTWQLLSEPS